MNFAVSCVLAVALLPGIAHATKVECAFEKSLTGPEYLELDTQAKVASILYPGLTGILRGKVTRISKSGDGSDAYNLSFTDLKWPFKGKESEWEFVLHRNGGQWMLLGAGYSIAEGRQYLSSSKGDHRAKCRVAKG